MGPVVLLPLREGVIPVDEWRPEPEDLIVTYSAKSITIPFDKLIAGINNSSRNVFTAAYKDSYAKKFDFITRYINYFIKYYDDGELIMNYLYCKRFIDSKNINANRRSMIKFIYETFVTPTMYQKVMAFVEDNYRIDVSSDKNPNKEYSESLEFTNRHAKLMILISTFIKFLIPIVLHYISMIKGKSETRNLILYYKPLFTVVERVEHVDLYAKLFNSINIKVNFNESKNKVIWAKYEANSDDTVSYTEELLDKNLIVDNIFKYDFYENLISFNTTILKTQLQYRCVKNFGITMREISDEKDSEGLSYLDKLEMNTVKLDEGNMLLSQVNIKSTIKKLSSKLHIRIPKEEVEFYMKNHKISYITKSLVFYYYAKYFGGFNDLKHITLKQYMKLMVMMKKRLRLLGNIWIPMIISANLGGKINSRLIHNGKFIDDVEQSSTYINLSNDKYNTMIDMGRSELLISPLATLVNTQFNCVEYDTPELLNEPIMIDIYQLSQEYLEFVDKI